MWQKIKDGFRSWMIGRHGSDQLSLALLIGGLVLYLIGSLTRIGLFVYVSMAAYIWSLFRMFSRNNAKRTEENMKWISFYANVKPAITQFIARLKNSRKYHYFRCPQCKARLRLPRKVGEVTVTCGKCKHQFRKKA